MLPTLLCPLHSHVRASLCSLLGSAGVSENHHRGLSRTPAWLYIFITRPSHVALKFHTHDQGLPSNLQRTGGPLLVSPQMSTLLIRNIVVPSCRVRESLLRAEHNGLWPEKRTWVVSDLASGYTNSHSHRTNNSPILLFTKCFGRGSSKVGNSKEETSLL